MTHPPLPPSPPDDGELLSAYLAGELDDAAVDALERRLADEAPLRAALEAQRRLQERLAEAIAPAAPAGAGDRLRNRLAAARAEIAAVEPAPAGTGEPEGAGAAAAAGPVGDGPALPAAERAAAAPAAERSRPEPAAPASLGAARERRRQRSARWSARWPALGGVAAALVAVAVLGVGVLNPADRGTEDAGVAGDVERQLAEAPAGGAGDSAAQGDAVQESAEGATGEEGATAMQAPEAEQGLDPAAGGGEEGRQALLEPVVVDAGTVLVDPDAAAAHLTASREVDAVLGTGAQDAADLAEAFGTALREHPPLSDGTSPGSCLDALAEGLDGPVVPVRVERLTYQGAPALAYVFATASRPGGPLDAAGGRIVEATPACTTLLDVPLPAETE